ncbi:hypothetical protein COV11_01160 [Candidatus Woesearchaeota archaeon CG10_big_fil_rev_8_21_14_0_10_30_7]|nr:MAG: hypothetical protein COV11_01160 [Candidatus Woesearchaeota archaeon CG10_big_fil_rev_8_21_14_0_10_30_7]
MVCLDTTFLIDLLRGKDLVRELKDELDETETIIGIPTPALMELWSGACLSASNNEKQKILELIKSLEIFPLDMSSAKEAGEIEAELTKKGLIIETEDMMIAGITKKSNQKLVTRDSHYARIEGLKIIKY